MKKILVLTMMFLMLVNVNNANAQSQIEIVVDGEGVSFTDAVPFIDENNRTLVPLRAVGEAMGLTVNWDPKEGAVFTKKYTWENSPMHDDLDEDGINDAYLGLEKVIFKIGENKALYEESWYDKGNSPNENFPVSGGIGEIHMDTTAVIKDSRTYAPVRYLAEIFRYDVGWESNTVMLNYMYPLDKLGIQIEQVACWKDYQGWFLIVDDGSDISSIDILSVSVNKDLSEYSMLTEDEKKEVEGAGLDFGSYRTGFTVHKSIETGKYYNYKVKILVTMKDGTNKFGFADIYLYFDGQGGFI